MVLVVFGVLKNMTVNIQDQEILFIHILLLEVEVFMIMDILMLMIKQVFFIVNVPKVNFGMQILL